MIEIFTPTNFIPYCNTLASQHVIFATIIKQYGYPTPYTRPPTFATLVHIILEQQVSLASAKAAYNKLITKVGLITPHNILALSNEALKECYCSKQKINYIRNVATAILQKQIVLSTFSQLNNQQVREALLPIKGIGNWSVDVYLMMALHRLNLFPIGDIALVNSMKYELQLPPHTTKEELLHIANTWQPYLTIASFLLWHAYIIRKGIKV